MLLEISHPCITHGPLLDIVLNLAGYFWALIGFTCNNQGFGIIIHELRTMGLQLLGKASL